MTRLTSNFQNIVFGIKDRKDGCGMADTASTAALQNTGKVVESTTELVTDLARTLQEWSHDRYDTLDARNFARYLAQHGTAELINVRIERNQNVQNEILNQLHIRQIKHYVSRNQDNTMDILVPKEYEKAFLQIKEDALIAVGNVLNEVSLKEIEGIAYRKEMDLFSINTKDEDFMCALMNRMNNGIQGSTVGTQIINEDDLPPDTLEDHLKGQSGCTLKTFTNMAVPDGNSKTSDIAESMILAGYDVQYSDVDTVNNKVLQNFKANVIERQKLCGTEIKDPETGLPVLDPDTKEPLRYPDSFIVADAFNADMLVVSKNQIEFRRTDIVKDGNKYTDIEKLQDSFVVSADAVEFDSKFKLFLDDFQHPIEHKPPKSEIAAVLQEIKLTDDEKDQMYAEAIEEYNKKHSNDTAKFDPDDKKAVEIVKSMQVQKEKELTEVKLDKELRDRGLTQPPSYNEVHRHMAMLREHYDMAQNEPGKFIKKLNNKQLGLIGGMLFDEKQQNYNKYHKIIHTMTMEKLVKDKVLDRVIDTSNPNKTDYKLIDVSRTGQSTYVENYLSTYEEIARGTINNCPPMYFNEPDRITADHIDSKETWNSLLIDYSKANPDCDPQFVLSYDNLSTNSILKLKDEKHINRALLKMGPEYLQAKEKVENYLESNPEATIQDVEQTYPGLLKKAYEPITTSLNDSLVHNPDKDVEAHVFSADVWQSLSERADRTNIAEFGNRDDLVRAIKNVRETVDVSLEGYGDKVQEQIINKATDKTHSLSDLFERSRDSQ